MATTDFVDGQTVIAASWADDVDDATYNRLLTGSVTYGNASMADGTGETTTITVTGAAIGDFAIPAYAVSTQGATFTANVTSANTVSVRVQNETGGTLVFSPSLLYVLVIKRVFPFV